MRSARWSMLPALVALLALAPAARAEVDPTTRAAARATAEDALARFDKADYTGALDLFNRADALVHAPTLGLMAARCLDRLGRLVEASERYLAVTRLPLDRGAPEAQAKAQVTAAEENAALLPRVPVLVIALEGATADARVTIDGQPVPAEILGLKRPTDPGPHRLEARRGTEVASREIILKEGDAPTVTLRLSGAPLPPATPGTGMRPVGWAGVGLATLGGAGLLVGVITGGLAVSAKSSLDAEGCVGGHCPPTTQSSVNRYDTLRLASGGGLIVGGIVAAAGVALAVVGARARPAPDRAGWAVTMGALPPNPWLRAPWTGLGTVGVGTRF
jgi:hypothetical protein